MANQNHFLDYNGLLYFWGKLKTKFANITHTHAISDVTNLQTELSGKAATSHNHTVSDITDIQDALDDKADVSHSHAASDITSGTIDSARLPTAAANVLGAVKVGSRLTITNGVLSADEQSYTHPTYTAYTGKPTANATPDFGDAVTVSQVVSDTTGHVSSMTDRTITIPDTVMGGADASTAGAKGLVPAPPAGGQVKFLAGDGTWKDPGTVVGDTQYTFATGTTNGAFTVTPSTAGATTQTVPIYGLGDLAYLDSLSKSDVGLGNVDNTADANKTVSKANTLTTARTIDGVSFDGSANIIHYGTGSFATSSTNVLSVACSGFTLAEGARIVVKLPNSASSSTTVAYLNVNNTGDKQAYFSYKKSAGSGITWASLYSYYVDQNQVLEFVYDGSNHYRLIGMLDTNTTYSSATQSANGLMSSTDKTKLDGFSAASDYALKTDIVAAMHYKGAVATVADLPASGNEVGDMYNVTANGMNYAWDGTNWDPMGDVISIDSITNSEIDTILAS